MFKPRGLARRWALLISGDFLIATFSADGVFAIVGRPHLEWHGPLGYGGTAIMVGILYIAAIHFEDLYAIERPLARSRIVAALLSATAKLAVLLSLLVLIAPGLDLGRRYYAIHITIAALALIAWRLAVATFFAGRTSIGVLILGNGECSRLVAKEVTLRAHLGYKLLGTVAYSECPAPSASGQSSADDQVYEVSSLDKLPVHSRFMSLVVTDQDSSPFPVRELMQWRVHGNEVIDLESFYERMTGKLPVALLRETWLVFAPGFVRSRLRAFLKRTIDIAGTIAIGLVFLPVALVAVLFIPLESRGPVLYSQQRVGLDGRPFLLYKFRSMRDGAEHETGPVWAAVDDARVTRLGRLIRRFRIDELPQLFNVLRGDMSLVGPRAERPEMVAELSRKLPLFDYRHSVRPGLTGWAQICWPYGASLDDARDKLCYDLYYIKNWSLVFDLQIIIQTPKVMLFGRGAR
jgi:sugar transferase (PEP-CTERM system associated)